MLDAAHGQLVQGYRSGCTDAQMVRTRFSSTPRMGAFCLRSVSAAMLARSALAWALRPCRCIHHEQGGRLQGRCDACVQLQPAVRRAGPVCMHACM